MLLPVSMGKLFSHHGQPKIRGNFWPAERRLVGNTQLYSFTVYDILGMALRERQSGGGSPDGPWNGTDIDCRSGSGLTSFLICLLIMSESQHL